MIGRLVDEVRHGTGPSVLLRILGAASTIGLGWFTWFLRRETLEKAASGASMIDEPLKGLILLSALAGAALGVAVTGRWNPREGTDRTMMLGLFVAGLAVGLGVWADLESRLAEMGFLPP